MRIIARLDLKNDTVVKPVRFDGLKVVGNPNEMARRYYEQGADELLLIDVVASLYERRPRFDVLEAATEGVFCPVTYCGGIRSVDDMRQAMRHGADKVAINTAALARPELISECAFVFGSQAVVVSIEAKKRGEIYEAYSNSGREPSGREVGEWAKEAERCGAGEILVTSIDRDGTMEGYDLALLERLGCISVPLLFGGGIGDCSDAFAVDGKCSGRVLASALHAGKCAVEDVRKVA